MVAKFKITNLEKIEYALRDQLIYFTREFKFAENRKFKADIKIVDYSILIEYEGIFSTHSRHTNVIGYAKDCEKYTLATVLGYKVLRYTAYKFNVNKVIEDVLDLINQSNLEELK